MKKKNPIRRVLASSLVCMGLGMSLSANAAEPKCEIDRPVTFGGMNWESNLLLVGVEQFIVEHGYGCKTHVEQGDTLPMFAALQRGDVDINSEVWQTQMQGPWDKAMAEGSIKPVGTVFTGVDGIYIPRYTAEKFPQLRRVADLKGMAEHFTDAEEPGRGRVYSCAAGWTCATLTRNQIRAHGLDGEYNAYSPGNAAAQRAAITSAYKRKRDVVFYYWTPTSLAGSLDLVKLELPPVDKKKTACIADPDCANPQPSGFESYPVKTVVNSGFAEQAPTLVAFLAKVNVPDTDISKILGRMDEEGLEIQEAAHLFLKEHGDTWRKWVPDDVAQRVQAALDRQA